MSDPTSSGATVMFLVSPRPRLLRVVVVAATCAAMLVGMQVSQHAVSAQATLGSIDAPATALEPAVRGGRTHVDTSPAPEGKVIFPVVPTGYCGLWYDSFGASRDNGARSHEGTDIMVPAGSPILAVADGVLTKRYLNDGSAGYGWTLHDPVAEVNYKYFHQMPDPAGRVVGEHVVVGDVLGYVGDSGADAGAFHLHFEYHLDSTRTHDGPARDPLPILDIPMPPCRIN